MLSCSSISSIPLRELPGYSNSLDVMRTCSWQMPAMVPPSRIRKTPAVTADAASPADRPFAARCAATSDDEHAVCVARQGPGMRQRSFKLLLISLLMFC